MNMTARSVRTLLLCTAVIGGLGFFAHSSIALENAGFELPDKGGAGFEYEPSGASWTFSAAAGLAGPDSVWKCNSTSPDPLGDQFAFLQRAASITNDVNGFQVDGTYTLSFYEAYRTQMSSGNDLLVVLDEGLGTETNIYSNTNVNNTTWILRQCDPFVAEKESYTLTFRSTQPLGEGDRTTLIDGVLLQSAISYVSVTNDANCDINPYKAYTHAIDFQASGAGATVNDVVFSSVAGSGAGFSRTVANGAELSDNRTVFGTTPITTTGGLADLMQGFIYNGSPNTDGSGLQTYTLSGLTSGTTYDLRIYTHAWTSGGTRPNTFVFDVDGAAVPSQEINEDNATSVGMPGKDDSYYINYRFTASAPDFVFTAANAVGSDASWHLYGLTCEQVGPVVSSLMPADNAIYAGASATLVMTFDDLIQIGTGNITIKRSSDNSVVETVDVESTAVTANVSKVSIVFSNTLARSTGYYVEVDAGAIEDLSGRGFGGISGNSLWNFTTAVEEIACVPISNDADCDIRASKDYTHKLDFGAGSPGALINGVQFDRHTSGASISSNFSYAVSSPGSPLVHNGNTPPSVAGDLVNLMRDMYIHNGNAAGGTATWTLSGLTAGVRYETRIYVRQWGASDSRNATMVFDPDGAGPISHSSGLISEDNSISVGMPAADDAYYISYTFEAVDGENLVITVTQHNSNASWHLYGLSNEIFYPAGMIMILR